MSAARDRSIIKDMTIMGARKVDIRCMLPHLPPTTVECKVDNVRLYGDVHRPRIRSGTPRIITKTMIEFIIDLMAKRPGIWPDEVRYHLLMTFDIYVSVSTISRRVKNHRFTMKVMQHVAAQRSPILRLHYRIQVVLVDESAANERTLDRKFGWSPRGMSAVTARALEKSKRWGVLLALANTGYLDGTLITKGNIDSKEFADWLEQSIIPQTEEFPWRRSVIIVDNMSTHRTKVGPGL